MLLHRRVAVGRARESLWALAKRCGPDAARRYQEGKSGDALPAVRRTMEWLSASAPKAGLAETASVQIAVRRIDPDDDGPVVPTIPSAAPTP